MSSTILLSSHYLPSIAYLSCFTGNESILIEQHEHFIKQSYRNRCEIAGANGRLSLTVPIVQTHKKIAVKDLRIPYVEPWQRIHWNSIKTAYNTSAFFEFYADHFAKYYDRHFEFLLDYNHEILDTLAGLLKFTTDVSYSKDYYVENADKVWDLRSGFHPKARYRTAIVPHLPYHQVFQEKYGFLDNLSTLDLLCNLGPQTSSYLQEFRSLLLPSQAQPQ